MIHRLANLQTVARSGSFVVFVLKHRPKLAPLPARVQQERLQAILDKINDGLQEFPNPDRVDVSIMQGGQDLAAKLRLIEAKLRVAPPRPSSLDRVQRVVQATEDLRAGCGFTSGRIGIFRASGQVASSSPKTPLLKMVADAKP